MSYQLHLETLLSIDEMQTLRNIAFRQHLPESQWPVLAWQLGFLDLDQLGSLWEGEPIRADALVRP